MITVALLGIFVAVIPVALGLAQHQYSAGLRHASSVRAHLYRSTATLTADAPKVSGSMVITGVDTVDVAARWTDDRGQLRHGTVAAALGDHRGTTIPVWLNPRGAIADPPDDPATIKANAVSVGLAVVIASALGLEMIRRWVRWRLDRTRLQSWEEEWRRVGPKWTKRRPA
ncbi:MAG TPA: hypothetical protein VHC49_08165 [Mycobacteriales bacterium]|nr:hypothetical protein [Mycobacteriales bacterium]